MKKFFKKLLFLLLFQNFSYALVLPENDWIQENIKARVKSIKIEKIVYDYENKEDKTKRIIHFNDKGFKISEEVYTDEGNASYKENYKYDNRGLLSTVSDDTGVVIFDYSYKTDKSGNLIQIKTKREKSEREFEEEKITYNKNGKKISTEQRYGEYKEIIVREGYIYDVKGRLKEIKDELHNNSIINEYRDINKNFISYEMTTYLSGRIIISYYDKNANRIEEQHFKIDDMDKPVKENHFYYSNTIDNHKNLLKLKIYEVKADTGSKKLKILEKRYYEYYWEESENFFL